MGIELNFETYFKDFLQMENIQLRQKQRGLNDYNILTSVLNKNDEVRLHSRMIKSFLDPEEKHYQDTLFLDIFLKTLNLESFKIKTKRCWVENEYKNIDIYITDNNYHIILENKLHAKDQEEQIKRYIDQIYSDNKNVEYYNIIVLYLSINREKPDNYSLGEYRIKDKSYIEDKKGNKKALFKNIHYKNEIITWLDQCQYEMQNTTNMNEAIKQYKDVVHMINDNYKGKVMELTDLIKKNKDYYRVAYETMNELPKIRKEYVVDFFKSFEDRINDKWFVLFDESKIHTKGSHPFKIKKNKDDKVYFIFEFEEKEFCDGGIGIYSENKDIKYINSKKDIQKIDNTYEADEADSEWLFWKWLPDTDNTEDFVQLIIDDKEQTINELEKLINEFEDLIKQYNGK